MSAFDSFNKHISNLMDMLETDLKTTPNSGEALKDMRYLQMLMKAAVRADSTVIARQLHAGQHLAYYENYFLTNNRSFIEQINVEEMHVQIKNSGGGTWLGIMEGLKTIWSTSSEGRRDRLWQQLMNVYTEYVNCEAVLAA